MIDDYSKKLSKALEAVGFEGSHWLGSRIRYFLLESEQLEQANQKSEELLRLLLDKSNPFYFAAKQYIDDLFQKMVATGFSRPIQTYDFVAWSLVHGDRSLSGVCLSEDKPRLFKMLSEEWCNVCFTPVDAEPTIILTKREPSKTAGVDSQ